MDRESTIQRRRRGARSVLKSARRQKVDQIEGTIAISSGPFLLGFCERLPKDATAPHEGERLPRQRAPGIGVGLVRRSRSLTVHRVLGDCKEPNAIPYGPLVDVIRDTFRIAEPDPPDVIADKLAAGLALLALDANAMTLPYLLHLLARRGRRRWPG
jgi:hypothetical protein